MVFPTLCLFASCLERYRKARGKWSWPQPCGRRVHNEIFPTQFPLVVHVSTISCKAQAALRDLLDASEADKFHAGLRVHERDCETKMRSRTKLDGSGNEALHQVYMLVVR